MKYLLFLFFGLNAYCLYKPESKVNDCDHISYMRKGDCESFSGELCVNQTVDCNYAAIQSNVIGQDESGDDIIEKITVEDAALKAAYEAKIQKENAIKLAESKISCGKKVIAYLTVLNAPKGLTIEQIKTMNQTYSAIKDLLETGSLETARAEILNVTADGTLITESDKTNLVSELDSCK